MNKIIIALLSITMLTSCGDEKKI
ncbi:lipoprotein [Flavobacterium psychrophilum]